MSYQFDREDGSSIWIPSRQTGELFVLLAESISGSIQFPTGLEMLASDWWRVHPNLFGSFVSAIVTERWENRSFRELIIGFTSTSIVLLERMGENAAAGAIAARTGLEDRAVLDPLRAAMTHI
jgi:Family of unknown function (DUF6086)